MDLQVIRQYLDILDQALKNILLQRMSIIPLVAETKLEQGLAVFQPEREEKMYKSMRLFAQETGLNPELLTEVFKNIIKDAHRIEHEFENPEQAYSKMSIDEKNHTSFKDLTEKANKSLDDFNKLMAILIIGLKDDNIKGEQVTNLFTQHYKEKILEQVD